MLSLGLQCQQRMHRAMTAALTCDVVPVKACGIKLLDVWVECGANLQQVIHVLVHQAISTQHLTHLHHSTARHGTTRTARHSTEQ